MGKGGNTAGSPRPVGESCGNVEEDSHQRDDNGVSTLTFHIVRDGRTNLVGTYDSVRIVHRCRELLLAEVLVKELASVEGVVDL